MPSTKMKNKYRNMTKYNNYVRRNRAKNYAIGRVGSIRHKWTSDEDELILNSNMTDRQLAKLVNHSVQAIQIRRCRLKQRC